MSAGVNSTLVTLSALEEMKELVSWQGSVSSHTAPDKQHRAPATGVSLVKLVPVGIMGRGT